MWLTARDRIAEFTTLLALIAGTLARIGNEVYNLQRPEIGELSEAPTEGVVGSITMPQKRNPNAPSTSSRSPAWSVPAPGSRSKASWASTSARRGMEDRVGVPAGKRVQPPRCRSRSAPTWSAACESTPSGCARTSTRKAATFDAEQVMLELAQRVGKHRAHELVHRAALAGQRGEA